MILCRNYNMKYTEGTALNIPGFNPSPASSYIFLIITFFIFISFFLYFSIYIPFPQFSLISYNLKGRKFPLIPEEFERAWIIYNQKISSQSSFPNIWLLWIWNVYGAFQSAVMRWLYICTSKFILKPQINEIRMLQI